MATPRPISNVLYMMSVSIFGERQSGPEVRAANVTAVQAVANILRTSLGPQGLDKMIVDDIGDVTITNDGATILKQLEIQHPAARVLVDLSDLQDQEVGDGTTSVVLIAAELLRHANELVKLDVHPTSVISGYKLAMKESVRYIQEHLGVTIDISQRAVLLNIAKTALNSKFIGVQNEHFAGLVVDALHSVKTSPTDTDEPEFPDAPSSGVNDGSVARTAGGGDAGATSNGTGAPKRAVGGTARYPVSAVNVLKTQGKSAKESTLVDGYAIKVGRAAQGMPTFVKNAKIALVDFNLRQHRLQLGITIKVDAPEELEAIRQKYGQL
eukprot:GHVT01005750.1.p1 GENE.GHVT01005750.1~~GHVT01005750.1.p1  ORF type:complete len:325 (+),score=42.59 GHVT01005750.1:239-1213(+)